MITHCNTEFQDESYLFDYPFSLSNFQKWAIKGINENKNILITAHTGSGKRYQQNTPSFILQKKVKK